jgi:hypothetical protein
MTSRTLEESSKVLHPQGSRRSSATVAEPPSGRQGANKLDLLSYRNILEHSTCEATFDCECVCVCVYVCVFSQVAHTPFSVKQKQSTYIFI